MIEHVRYTIKVSSAYKTTVARHRTSNLALPPVKVAATWRILWHMWMSFMTARFDVTPKRTQQNLIVRSGKCEKMTALEVLYYWSYEARAASAQQQSYACSKFMHSRAIVTYGWRWLIITHRPTYPTSKPFSIPSHSTRDANPLHALTEPCCTALTSAVPALTVIRQPTTLLIVLHLGYRPLRDRQPIVTDQVQHMER